MKLGFGGGKKQEPVEKAQQKRSFVVRFPFTGTPVPAGGMLLDRYPLTNPYAYAAIVEDESGGRRYYLDEVPLTHGEANVYSYILDKLETELTIPRADVDPKKYFAEQAKRIVAKYGIKVAPIPWAKILYFAERDLVGFGVLDAMLKDPNIEDISVDGVGKPIFVYHRRFESLGTNMVFTKDADLDSLITRLAHMSGKHISTAFPILQGTLPGRHRLMATFRREISPYGSTLTIRKFRTDPLTVTDLLNSRVIDQKMAAYFWLLMENKATSLIVGSTGSGKTTLLNALLTMTRTNSKIVTIEEVQEVNIPHFNWTALLARENYGATGDISSQVNLFDLVKAAMRMRPDIIVVGEVRGEEAYVLFQAISTGHGGMCSLHADDVESAIQRLTSKPMDVPPAFIPFLDLTFTVRRISIPNPGGGFRAVRRIVSVDEVVKAGEYFNAFRWNPATDAFKPSELRGSPKLNRLAKDLGMTLADVTEELNRRSVVLRWLQERGVRNFREVSAVLEDYSARPALVFQKAAKELGIAGTPEAVAAEGFKL
ncbi:MAG: type II/IV secretion system ATPase subunit [Nitrososphaerota archaeon]|jgi:flagellar protein FlaI|nr:type II/IV secretion system ATPase subunit [Nitrososphaerota archaeon]MDG6951555.1 type II/IV secretion system ATPase subunit [Nitrososphaerota archaeon]MDG6968517.1 type II/IV secretion system ATPase subunit [Nitrososphaerota archaeon]MDG6987498.1 type II/IV secretion system ATPase subunit [Nitrososphaerota archaeon]MDG6990156.1 type II/IV secretion system ATPase subunit [Nitrososphaerota archaeon]